MSDTPRPVLVGLMLLTFVTGIVDAASVLALGHVFTANMTGNVVFLGFALANQGATSVASSVLALAGFLLGALIGGRISKTSTPATVKIAFGLELLIFASAGVVAFSGAQLAKPIVVGLLAFAMGLRNAVVRKMAVADMTTTVLTLTLTGLAADSSLAGGSNPRWVRRITAVLMMLAGASVGAFLLSWGIGSAVGVAALVETCAVVVLVRSNIGDRTTT